MQSRPWTGASSLLASSSSGLRSPTQEADGAYWAGLAVSSCLSCTLDARELQQLFPQAKRNPGALHPFLIIPEGLKLMSPGEAQWASSVITATAISAGPSSPQPTAQEEARLNLLVRTDSQAQQEPCWQRSKL